MVPTLFLTISKQLTNLVGPNHPDGEVIQPSLADIALPDPPQPPVYLKNAPYFRSEHQQQRDTQEEELHGAANMDISDGEEESHKSSKKTVVPCVAPAPQSAVPPQSPCQYIQSPRISEASSSSSRSNRPLTDGQHPKTREASYEAIENKIRNQLKNKMQAEFEVQFNAMKANYKNQIDQFLKQIMHLENTLKKKEQADKEDKDTGNMPRINALVAEKAKLEGIITCLRTTILDNQTLSDSLQAKHADQLMAKEQEMRDREKDAVTRYLSEQNKARNLEGALKELREKIKGLEQCSDTTSTLEDENSRLKDKLKETVTELKQSKADAASMQTVLEEAQMQLETDKCMLRNAEEEFDKKMDQVNRQRQLDRQEIASWKDKHDTLEARLSIPQKTVQTMTTFTLATEDHLIKCVDETMEMKWKLTQTCQDYKQKMVALNNANEENKATKAQLECVTNNLKLAVIEVAKLKANLEDSQKKLEEERNQATAITVQMLEMEEKLNVEKICVGIQTDVVDTPVVVEQSAPPLDPVLSRPSSISLTSQATQNDPTSSSRKRSHGVSEIAQKQNTAAALPATSVANESDDDIIFEKTVKPTKKRTKSNPKISVRDIVAGPPPSLNKVPKRDISEVSCAVEESGNILHEAESSSSPSVRLVTEQNNTEEAAQVTSPDSSTLSAASPMGAVPQVFASNATGGQANKTATPPTVGFQLPLRVTTSGSSARASPSSYSDASTVSPSTYYQNTTSLRAGSKQAKHPMLSQTLSQAAGQRYNSAGFKVETNRGIVPPPVDPFLAQSQQSALMNNNPMQDPLLHSRFVQLFDQHQGQQTQAVSMSSTLQQHQQPGTQPLMPITYGHNSHQQQQAHPSQPTNPQNLKVIAEANRVLEAFFAFLLVNATHQPACCVLIPFCNSYNIPEKERAGLLAQLEPLAYLFDQMKVENLATLRNRHRSSSNKNV